MNKEIKPTSPLSFRAQQPIQNCVDIGITTRFDMDNIIDTIFDLWKRIEELERGEKNE